MTLTDEQRIRLLNLRLRRIARIWNRSLLKSNEAAERLSEALASVRLSR